MQGSYICTGFRFSGWEMSAFASFQTQTCQEKSAPAPSSGGDSPVTPLPQAIIWLPPTCQRWKTGKLQKTFCPFGPFGALSGCRQVSTSSPIGNLKMASTKYFLCCSVRHKWGIVVVIIDGNDDDISRPTVAQAFKTCLLMTKLKIFDTIVVQQGYITIFYIEKLTIYTEIGVTQWPGHHCFYWESSQKYWIFWYISLLNYSNTLSLQEFILSWQQRAGLEELALAPVLHQEKEFWSVAPTSNLLMPGGCVASWISLQALILVWW